MAYKLFDVPFIDWSKVKPQVNKYVPLKRAYEQFDNETLQVMDMMLSSDIGWHHDSWKSCLIDYKVRDLDTGDCGCPLEGWHIDVTRNPNHPSRRDMHMVYSNVNGTEFLSNINMIGCTDFSEVDTSTGIIRKAGDSEIWAYSRDLHRGPIMKEPCRRVLIRMTMTDIL